MLIIKRCTLWLFGVLCLTTSTHVSAILIDLNTLSPNVSSAVTISGDGSSATFNEDTIFSPVALWTPGLAMPADSEILSFDYELIVATSNTDYFDFYLDNLTAPIFSVGGAADEAEPLIFSGTYTIDVSSFASSSLPLVFSFINDWGDAGFDSTVTISNLEIIERSVPEPATLMLLAVGLFCIAWLSSYRVH